MGAGNSAAARNTGGGARDALLTDFYQLTMLQGYLAQGMREPAVFEFFVRKLPPTRGFLLAAGLEQLLGYLQNLRFDDEEIAWLGKAHGFDASVLDYLADFRFKGDVDALPEGTVFFTDTPIVRVTAPMPEAQLVESRLINILHFQTLIAAKAARMVLTAPDALLIDFGFRRAHGGEAGLYAARASYIAGFAGTATVGAEWRYGVPAYGTVAHSFIQAHDREVDAFINFARAQPENTVLLIDTYDTVAAARQIVELAPKLQAEGIPIRGVRLDSGDLADLAHQVRGVFDAAGLTDIRIFASSSIDEYALAELVKKDTPIDGYGIGTHLTTSADAPYLDCAYKLQEYAGLARRKRSAGKATWPGRKQAYRRFGENGVMAGDCLTLLDDPQPGTPMLVPVMRDGDRLAPPEPLSAIRERATAQLAQLPAAVKDLRAPAAYPVEIAPALKALADEVDRRTAAA